MCPDKVNNALVLPEQIVVPPATVPPTVVGDTVPVIAVLTVVAPVLTDVILPDKTPVAAVVVLI